MQDTELRQESSEIVIPETFARLELQSRIDAITSLTEEHSHAFRWLTATLFAVNAGALLTTFQEQAVADRSEMWACIWFTAGVLCSLLAAWWNQRLMSGTITELAKARNYWAGIMHGLPYDEGEDSRFNMNVKDANKLAWIVSGLGWLSAGFFVLGMLVIGASVYGR